jgi:hypothetical protein
MLLTCPLRPKKLINFDFPKLRTSVLIMWPLLAQMLGSMSPEEIEYIIGCKALGASLRKSTRVILFMMILSFCFCVHFFCDAILVCVCMCVCVYQLLKQSVSRVVYILWMSDSEEPKSVVSHSMSSFDIVLFGRSFGTGPIWLDGWSWFQYI